MINFINKFLGSLSNEEFLYLQRKVWDEDTRRRQINAGLNPDPELDEQEIKYVLAGRKLDAIKSYRFRVGVGLREAKDVIEAYAARHSSIKEKIIP